MRSTHALLATALLATFAACTEDLDPVDPVGEAIDDPAEAVSKQTTGDPVVITDMLDVTSCAAPKVLICHIPPGNPDNAHSICVGDSAVPAHVNHGDNLGTCAARTTPPPPPPVCLPFGAVCSQDMQCCSNACVWDECIDRV